MPADGMRRAKQFLETAPLLRGHRGNRRMDGGELAAQPSLKIPSSTLQLLITHRQSSFQRGHPLRKNTVFDMCLKEAASCCFE